MLLKEWLDKAKTDYLQKVVRESETEEMFHMIRNTAVKFYLEELYVYGDFDIPNEKVFELSKEFFSEICLEILVREGKSSRSVPATMLKKHDEMLQLWWDVAKNEEAV